MTLLDWVLVVLLAGITLSGFWHGAVRIVFGLGGLVGGLWLAVVAGAELADAMVPWLGSGWLPAIIARLALLLTSIVVSVLAGWGLERTLRALHLGWANRLLGAGLAGAAAALLLAGALMAGSSVSPEIAAAAHRSRLAGKLLGALAGSADEGYRTPAPTPAPEPPAPSP